MIAQIEKYLSDNIQDDTIIKEWSDKSKLIYYYQDRYDYYQVDLLGSKVLLIHEKESKASLSEVKKHLKMLSNRGIKNAVILFTEISLYKRKIMMQEKIPFIIVDGQMYLPFLGLDLAKITKRAIDKTNQFTPIAQALYLYFLYNATHAKTINEISQLFGITQMHASRAFTELYDKDLLTYSLGGKTNRTKIYTRIADPFYYQEGHNYLKNPIINTLVSTHNIPHGPKCGVYALSQLTSISQPDYETYIIKKSERNKYAHAYDCKWELGNFKQYEVWSYDPTLISEGDTVDILSLYLTLRDLNDPRIEEELIYLLKGESWYKD